MSTLNSTDQTPAQRMTEIEQSLEDCAANRRPFGPGRDDFRFVIDRCRKLEKVAEAAVAVNKWERAAVAPTRYRPIRELDDALEAAGYGD